VKKFLLSLLLPITIFNNSQADVYTKVINQVNGENASVSTEVTNIVNQNKTEIKSSHPGEIEVKIKNEKVEIKATPSAQIIHTPPTSVSSAPVLENPPPSKIEKEIKVTNFFETLRRQFYNFFSSLLTFLK